MNLSNYKNILIGVLVIILLFLFSRWNKSNNELNEIIKINGKQYEVVSQKIDTIIVRKDTTIFRRGSDIIIQKEVQVPVYIPSDVDTMELLRDYFTKRFYVDTLEIKDFGSVVIKDTLFQNTILTREFIASMQTKIINDVIIAKQLSKPHLYFGGGVGIDKENILNNAHIGVLLRTKSNKIYGIEGGFMNSEVLSEFNTTPFINFKVYRKIGK